MGDIDPRVREIIAAEPSLRWFGFIVEEAADGRAVVSTVVRPEHLNDNGMAHGGFVFALADQAFAMAAVTVLGLCATADAQIHYLAPSRVNARLTATALASWHDSRRTVVDVAVVADGDIVATYRGMARTVRRV
ncbi:MULTISPECIES: PaaI family thioesterase [unclassified Microbacterium]|uniref:PaaI family thioesterase n=1 Tax=unclassified Microbacterium TaxID=2609290 RepID=UPI000EA97FFE|nr:MULTISPECIES: PaaI family thioesterase [unclassified Microbacterium]MBT2486527.1 PaaI family thioesterase [Microbacterium sp. ISL-108]RKN69220.1 PaaI family thioesterase [Microbacterium sp. CGR2]